VPHPGFGSCGHLADWFLASDTDKVSDLDTKLPEVKTVI
jgi:hypothetical protein